MQTKTLTGALFAGMVKSGAVSLRNNDKIVNDLNVFPIPDGDTGDNMSRTVEGGASAVAAAIAENAFPTVSDSAKTVADGMLLAARGNSGVILSQFFYGLALGLSGYDAADTATVASAFASGVRQAYTAVVNPTEGTILTVMREATEVAAARNAETLEEFFDSFTAEMYNSLERTPDLLPILRESGVIDSGGAGFIYIIEGMNRELRGETVNPTSVFSGQSQSVSENNTDSFDVDSEMKYGYCTELLVQLLNAKTDPDSYSVDTLIEYLQSIGGESIVAFKTGTRVKLHVHTFAPEKVLGYCRTIGEFVSVKIENMAIQHSETRIENRFVRPTAQKRERKPFGVVAVASGSGIAETFTQFGADYIVDGQQTMNPSTEDFIKAYRAVNADKIIVLPNNSNIILAAEQSVKLYTDSEIYVVNSRTLAEGYAAMTMLDFSSGDVGTVIGLLEEAIAGVTTGLVTYAVRDCEMCEKSIHKGDRLGFCGKEIATVAADNATAACGLLEKADMSGKEVIIMIAGKDATAAEVTKVRDYINTNLRSVELYEVDGGQDIYSFIFAIE